MIRRPCNLQETLFEFKSRYSLWHSGQIEVLKWKLTTKDIVSFFGGHEGRVIITMPLGGNRFLFCKILFLIPIKKTHLYYY